MPQKTVFARTLAIGWAILTIFCQPTAQAQDQMPSTQFEAVTWLESVRNNVIRNDRGEVTKIIIDYVPEVFVVGDLDIFPHLETLKINYTGQFHDRHMSGIARLTSLKRFIVDYCDEISEASLSVLRYLPQLEEIKLRSCEAVYSLNSLAECKSLKRIDISYNEHLDFHVLKTLQQLPALETLILNENATLEDQHLRWLAGMPKLREISLSKCSGITDDAAQYLAAVPNLKILNLSGNQKITGSQFHLLGKLSLEELDLRDCGVTDQTLSNFKDLRCLKKIQLAGNFAIAGSGLSVIGNFQRLEELILANMNVTNAQLQTLDGISTLKSVVLNECPKVSARGIAALTQSVGLENLELSGCPRIDGEDLFEICKFEKLKILDLTGTGVKTAGVGQLNQLNKLESLNLSKCNWIDDDAIEKVARFVALKQLTLNDVPRLTDQSLIHLAHLTTLETLSVGQNRHITGSGFAEFSNSNRLKKLELLNLERLSPRGLANLTRFEALEELRIELAKLTDAHLIALMGIPRIKELVLNSLTDVDPDVYQQLLNSLPTLQQHDDH